MSEGTSSKRVPKSRAMVSVRLNDGDMFEGHFFVSEDQRLTDLLNGPIQYLPFESANGAIYVINKEMIVRVIAKERSAAEEGGLINPEGSRW